MKPISLNEFYQTTAHLISENSASEIGHLNVFEISRIQKKKQETRSSMVYNRQAYNKPFLKKTYVLQKRQFQTPSFVNIGRKGSLLNSGMRKIICIVFYAFLLFGCTQKPLSSAATQQSPASSLPAEARIQRIVCFKFKPGTTPEAIEQHMRGFAGLKDSISYILSYQAGPTVRGDLNDKGEYDVMHYCTYRNEEEIKLYSVHPVHRRFIEQNKGVWEKVLVINSRLRP